MPKPKPSAKKNRKNAPQIRQFKPKRGGGNPHPNLPPVEHQFKPGVSGNPGGRPKLLSDAYREYLATINDKTGLTRAQEIAKAQGIKALTGDTPAAKELRSATEGELFKFVSNLPDDKLDELIESLAPTKGTAGGGAASETETPSEPGASPSSGDITNQTV